MSSKLAKWAINSWSRRVYEWKKENKTFPAFSELVKYEVIKAEIACDPKVLAERKSMNEVVAHTNEKNVDQISSCV